MSPISAVKYIGLLFLSILSSCHFLPRPTAQPVKVLAAGNLTGTELVVFLPGRWSRVEEFEKEKFFEIAKQHWPQARLTAPDLHLGYYKERSMARRLHEDVVLPAKRSGVKKVTLVGISMGGLGALIYDNEYPSQVDRMYLLSPFLGEEKVLQEISAAGSLAKWQPGSVQEDDFSRKLWLKLREKRAQPGKKPQMHLGCGTEDRLADANRLFAKEFLKATEQKWTSGGHDWPTWRVLFEKMVK